MYKPNYNYSMPTNLWFYYELVNMEADNRKAKYKYLLNLFSEFLFRKYNITPNDLKNKTYFEIVRERENDDDVIELYGNIWNSIDDLKHSSQNEVIAYIKSIKLIFNKGNFEDWIKQQKKNKPCNDC
ncbi:MAG: hypothetical protein FWG98_12440 [Candidatus Cloacimonetes bacterium]|nr:hypothetical protein [Candidatus Cloacimonadota bacterium]